MGSKALEVKRSGESLGLWLGLQFKLALFSTLRRRFGGRVRFLPVGGARLADEINLFFNAAGLNIKCGYGLTETSATVSCPNIDDLAIGTIGTPLNGLQMAW